MFHRSNIKKNVLKNAIEQTYLKNKLYKKVIGES